MTSTNPAKVNFSVSGKSGKATVKWNKVGGASGYIVYYKTSSNGKWIKLCGVNSNTSSVTKTGFKKGRTYYFAVRAYRNYNGKTYLGSYATKSAKIK